MSIATGENFWDNTNYNKSLVYRKPQKHNKAVWTGIGGISIMGPDTVLKELEKLGINMSERTLQRYVKDDLVPMPERKSGGRGKGRVTDYPEETPVEAYASYNLIHGEIKLPTEMVAEARYHALSFEENPYAYRDVSGGHQTWFMPLFFSDWLLNKGKAEKEVLDKDVEIAFIRPRDQKNLSWKKEIKPADKGLITIETRCVINGEAKRNIEYKIPRTKDIDYSQIKPLTYEP